ncbi:hypothetical protein WHZ77_26500 [Bradyrhizobium sp. A5]
MNAINRSFGVVLGIQDDKQINGSENERQWFSIAITSPETCRKQG